MHGVVIQAPKDLRIGTLAMPALQRNQVRVEVRTGGICGSDLHCFHNGGFGTVRLRDDTRFRQDMARPDCLR